MQEFRRNAFNTDSVDEALDLLDFCYKIVSRSGLSESGTYLPKGETRAHERCAGRAHAAAEPAAARSSLVALTALPAIGAGVGG